MIGTSRSRRKNQLEMLAEACQHRQRARIVPADDSAQNVMANTRLLELGDHGLYVEQPTVTDRHASLAGQLVDVYFEHDGQRFAFQSSVIGPDVWRDARCELAAWKLEPPKQIERRQQRDHYRVSMLDLGAIPVTFTRVDNAEDVLEATLLNISAGGISGRVPIGLAERVSVGDAYWTHFHLPDEPARFEFVARVMRVRCVEEQGIVLLGCRFCPTDEPRLHQAQLRRFERYIAERQRARLSRATLRGAGGE